LKFIYYREGERVVEGREGRRRGREGNKREGEGERGERKRGRVSEGVWELSY